MATRAFNGAHVLVLEGVTTGAPSCRQAHSASRGFDWKRKLGLQSQFLGRVMEPVAQVPRNLPSNLLQLRNAYTTTETIVGSLKSKEPGKRRLILLRHAKSSWADRSLKDHNRPLSKRGRLAAALIATKLEKHRWKPELILSSDSQRTRETLEIMQAHFSDLTDAEVRFLGSFYSVAAMDGQTAQHIQENVLKFTRDDVTTIMCMGHNRGWEEAASQLCGVAVELKTANAALLEAPGGSWKEAFEKAGMGGWKLVGIMKPDMKPDSTSDVEYEVV